MGTVTDKQKYLANTWLNGYCQNNSKLKSNKKPHVFQQYNVQSNSKLFCIGKQNDGLYYV